MAVRRHAARLATVGALLGGLVLIGAAPAMADDDLVRVRAADSFTAGGSAEGVSVEVRKRTDGCVMLRTALGLRLAGLQANQVTVQVSYGGRWFPVPLGGGSGALSTTQTAPAKPTLCKGKGITVRYRVTFAATAPNGRLSVVGEAGTASGRDLGRDADSARVTGGRALVSPTPSTKPSPTPTPEPTEAPADADSTPAALAAPTGGPATTDEDSSGLSPVMFVGLALVAVGALLIVFLVRRSRQDKASAGESVLPLPGNPGGTTYRAGGGVPAAPVQPGPVYGQPPATGGVYGVPSPRPSGGIYGARPDATRPLPGYPGGAAPTGPEPAPPAGLPGGATPAGSPGGAMPAGPGSAPPPAPGASSAHSPSPSGPPTPGPSSATSASTAGPSTPGPSSAPGQAGPPPAAGGGEHTVYMPRLPG
ncbi:hypothetical protein [Micromonospora costi]|uniref:hypothetical protein n=1 Tax=Micromonospora costi TaxID=1530042 RepID=UPI00131A1BB8|nr:hypothetical protein [Micromonospora costi]